jgi:hypothetical protein
MHLYIFFYACSVFVSLWLFFALCRMKELGPYLLILLAFIVEFFGNNFIMKFEIRIFMLISVLLCIYVIYRFF